MGWFYECFKSFLKWVIILLIGAGVFYVGLNHGSQIKSWLTEQESQESEPIKLHTPAPKGLVM